MSGLADVLRPGPPSFHLTDANQTDLGAATYALTLDQPTTAVRRIRGSRCRTATSLFDELAAALQFPAYFGGNWNAVRDMLSDLAWLPAETYLVIVEDADEFLADEPDEVLAAGLGVLAASPGSTPFHVVLQAASTGRVAGALTANGTAYDTVTAATLRPQ